MKISHLKANRITNPLGFTLWIVKETADKKQTAAQVLVAGDSAFKKLNRRWNTLTIPFWKLAISLNTGRKAIFLPSSRNTMESRLSNSAEDRKYQDLSKEGKACHHQQKRGYQFGTGAYLTGPYPSPHIVPRINFGRYCTPTPDVWIGSLHFLPDLRSHVRVSRSACDDTLAPTN